MTADTRYSLLRKARSILVSALAEEGVVDMQHVAAFPTFDDFAVWLVTATDAQRDRLGTENPKRREVREVLLQVGFTAQSLRGLTTTAESQETVQRDYEGNWFYALR